MKNKLKILFCVTIGGLGLIGCSPSTSLTSEESNYLALENRHLDCPEGAHPEYRRQGESSVALMCLVNHGPVIMAEYGRVAITGQYLNGKEIGEWRWYDKNGKITRIERHP